MIPENIVEQGIEHEEPIEARIDEKVVRRLRPKKGKNIPVEK